MTATALPAPPRARTAARSLAVLLATIGALLALAGIGLLIANLGTELPEDMDWRLADAGAIAFLAFGALLAIRLPHNPVAWIALAIGLFQTVATVANGWAVLALLTRDGNLAGGPFAQWVGTWVWLPGYALMPTLLLLLFPDGRLPSRRWRALVPASLVAIAAATASFALTPYEDLGEPTFDPTAPHPAAHPDVASVVEPFALLLLPCVLLCVASVVVRLRRAEGEERQQLRWFGAGVTVALLCLAAGHAAYEAAPVGLAAALVVLPAAITVGVLRHGLWQLGPIARRSVVYAVLSVAALAAYGLAVVVIGRGEAVITALVAVALIPLHARVDRAVNRLLYGERDEPFAAARRLGERLATPGDPLEEIRRALRLPRVAIADEPGADGISVPLVFAGERIGFLVAGGRELGPADRRALEELAPPLAAAVHARQLTEDLRGSRERLVAAREEERRRLRNDLHDEVGPSLAILALRLDAEGRDELAEQARADLARIRAIVRDLRPAALDDLGLAAALRQEVDGIAAGGLAAGIEVPEPLGELPAAAEVAAYRITREALSNVVRHARATRCTVRLTRTASALVVVVQDDGRGISDHAPRGIGLESMRARAEELGGSLTVESGAGGTTVEARLPL